MRPTRLLLALTVLISAAGFAPDAVAQSETTAAQKDDTVSYVCYHVIASGKKESGKEQVVPKDLKPFAKNLKRVPFGQFQLAGKKAMKIGTKAQTLTLPKKFGRLTVALTGKDKIGVSLQGATKDAKFAGSFLRTQPLFVASDKMKNSKGEQYILILVRQTKKK
ncbi:MAG: hypothetical protein AAF488_10960 [Planctomycetota bacterium]